MHNTDELKNYFSKLQKVIERDALISLFDRALVKKSSIDDILCCIFAKLPDTYKKILYNNPRTTLNSVICYKGLLSIFGKKKIMGMDMYLINKKHVKQLLSSIIKTITTDISYIEKNL